MSIQLLYELHSEVRRLFIAGSTLAPGNVRLSKLQPQLQKLGEGAPVFNRLSQAVQQVIEAEGEQAATKLLELGTLLHSILYTQGQSEVKGSFESAPAATTKGRTEVPYRKLKPLLDALTEKGPGRLEVIRQSYEDGLFQDMRTIQPAVASLDESYVEIADFVTEYVIPVFGQQALHVLQAQFQLQGGKGAVRRLRHMHRLLGDEGIELYLQAAAEGSVDVRAAAIELLGEYPEHEPLLLEQSRDKKKEIRRAALSALSRRSSESSMDRLFAAFTGKDRDIVIEPIQQCLSDALTERVLAYTTEQFEAWIEGRATEDTIPALLAAVQSMEGKRDEAIADLLQRMLSTQEFIVKDTSDVQEMAAQWLLSFTQPETDLFLQSLRAQWDRKFIAYSFQAAVRTLSPTELYDQYAKDFKNKQQTAGKELLRVIYALTSPLSHHAWVRSSSSSLSDVEVEPWEPEVTISWDPRWVHLFVDINEEDMVCRLALEGDKKIIAFLLKKWEIAPQMMKSRTVMILFTLFRLGYKDTPELVMQMLEQTKVRQLYYVDRELNALLCLLPSSYAERLEQFAAGLTYDSVKQQLISIIETIKANGMEPIQEQKGAGWIEWIKSKMY